MILSHRSGVPLVAGDEYTMALFTLQEVLEITSARVLSGQDHRRLDASIRRVCTDSREARPGDLFVALVGDRFDGGDFVGTAIRRGAVGAIVLDSGFCGKGDKEDLQPPRVTPAPHRKGTFLLGVSDPLRAYQELAAHHRRRFDLPVVAVTGSNGKTTTKEMVARVLAQRWTVLKTEGNRNNRIGVPQTVLRLTARHEVAVVEMGVDHLGQTTRLGDVVRPTVGLVTNIGPDHLEFFGSLDGSAQAKAELVDLMPATGALVLNADDPYFDALASRAACPVVSFGLSDRAKVRATDIASDPRRGIGFRLVLPGRMRHPLVRLHAHGTHNLSNALAAAAIGHVLGLSGVAIATGLARFRPAAMRSQVILRDGIRIINDCYNANPASMRAAIDVLGELSASKRSIAVLGDMLELGPDAVALHREVGGYLAGRDISYVIAAGTLGRHIAEGALAAGMSPGQVLEIPDVEGAAAVLKDLVREGDVVLIKASRGLRLERVIEALSGNAGTAPGQGRR